MLVPYITIMFSDGHEENFDNMFEVKTYKDKNERIGLVNAILRNFKNVECIYYRGVRMWTK